MTTSTTDDHRRNAIERALAELDRPENGYQVTRGIVDESDMEIAYDAMEPLIRQAVAEEIARVGDEWASKTIDLRAAPAYSAMADVARIIGKREAK